MARAACGREIVATSGKTECDSPSDPSHNGTTSSTGAIIPDRQDSDYCYYLGTALPIEIYNKKLISLSNWTLFLFLNKKEYNWDKLRTNVVLSFLLLHILIVYESRLHSILIPNYMNLKETVKGNVHMCTKVGWSEPILKFQFKTDCFWETTQQPRGRESWGNTTAVCWRKWMIWSLATLCSIKQQSHRTYTENGDLFALLQLFFIFTSALWWTRY